MLYGFASSSNFTCLAGAGTGGTICGLSAKIKEHNPNVKVVDIDSVGSILVLPD